MAQANTEQRNLLGEKLARRTDRVAARLRIAGAVAEQHAARLQLEDFSRRGSGRHEGDEAIAIDPQPQHIAPEDEVVDHDMAAAIAAIGLAGIGSAKV